MKKGSILTNSSYEREKRKGKIEIFNFNSNHYKGIAYNLSPQYVVKQSDIDNNSNINTNNLECNEKNFFVVTKEAIALGCNICGTIHCINYPLKNNLEDIFFIYPITVDPRFFGPLIIPVINPSDKNISFKDKQEFCSIVFQYTKDKSLNYTPVSPIICNKSINDIWIDLNLNENNDKKKEYEHNIDKIVKSQNENSNKTGYLITKIKNYSQNTFVFLKNKIPKLPKKGSDKK